MAKNVRSPPRSRRSVGVVTGLFALVVSAGASPNHDDLQGRETIQIAWQRYGRAPPTASGRRLGEQPAQRCERVAQEPWEPMRIGYEFLDAEDVAEDVKQHVEKQILARAIDYWSRALRVRRVSGALRADYVGRRCEKYGLAFDGQIITAEQHYTCEAAEPPMCGPHGLKIPSKFLRSKKVCSKKCPNVVETFSHLLKADRVCDNCTVLPEGPGADGYDFFVLVTLKDDFCSGDVQAHATTCVKDQCDRPIFGLINFCRAKISMKAEDTDRQVTTAVHELAHALAFSSHHFQYFRHSDGSPMIPREAENPSILKDFVPWRCDYVKGEGTRYKFPDARGDRRYVDLSAHGIIGSFDERGVSSCPCPVGQEQMQDGCILPPQPSFRAPKCSFRVMTPMVKKKVQEFFGCDSLMGAELENQPTSPCVIVSSHWEQRAFMGEVMVSAQVIKPTFLSEVTLALFHDSGWYLPDYGMADHVVKGVHWGYQQGCDFAKRPCIEDGKTAFPRFWCTSSHSRTCSLDRLGEVQCSTAQPPPDVNLPAVVDYSTSKDALLGFVAEADYCPFYHVQITNHVCTDTSSTTFPISNVNFERETFGARSRCLDSTLSGDVQAYNGEYQAEPDEFKSPKPRCYEVRCSEAAYEVWVSDLEGGKVKLGTCSEDGQALSGLGLQGAVTCAAPEEMCGLRRATHLGNASSTQPVELVADPGQGLAGAPGPGSETLRAPGAFGAGVLAGVGVLTAVLAAVIVTRQRRRRAYESPASSWTVLPQGQSPESTVRGILVATVEA